MLRSALLAIALAGSPVLAAVDGSILATAPTPLPTLLPPPRPMPELPAAIPLASLQVELGDGTILAPAQAAPVISLDGTWRCSGLVNATHRFADDIQLERGWQRPDFDDSSWPSIAVPLDWYRAFPAARTAKQPYVVGWYRRALELGAEAAGRRAILHFGVAPYQADLWVNGQPAGSHHGDFTPWDIDITPWIVPGRNVLALRLRSDFGPKFGAGEQAWHAYGSQWSIGNIKGGLWQSCSLRLEEPLRFTQVLVAPVPGKQALRVDWRAANTGRAARRVSLRAIVQNARQGNSEDRPADAVLGEVELPPGDSSGSVEVAVPGIRTWSPERPELYWLTLLAQQGGAVAGFRCERFGFRTFAIRDGRFQLNGQRTYLFGENLKSLDYSGNGESPAMLDERIARDLRGLRENGYTIFRTAHMPADPLLLWRADEFGLMVYDEWAWCFTGNLDPAEFPARNDRELRAWVLRDHNHPSVVMWSCGNEVRYDDDAVRTQLDRQVATVRSMDLAGRPISSFSGAAYGYGQKALDTDVLDRHTYHGLSGGPWSSWERNAGDAKAFMDRAYQPGWQATKPFIIWECVGFSWGQIKDPEFKPHDPESYLRYAERSATWGAPAGIGFAGTVGLAAFFDPAQGLAAARRTYGRRIAEFIRRDPLVSGFAPWFTEPGMAEARQWTQPVFACLYGANRIALRHPIAGSRHQQTLVVVNDGSTALSGATARISLAGRDAAAIDLATLALPTLAPGDRIELPLAFTLPGTAASGWWQLQLRITAGPDEVSCLGYDLFTTPADSTRSSLGATLPVAVLGGAGEPAVRRWLGDLGVSAQTVASAESLPADGVLIVPPRQAMNSAEGGALRTWIRAGGRALVLEQVVGRSEVLGQSVVPAPNTFVDLVVPSHPVFAGLTQLTFDTSDGPNGGLWVQAGLKPLTVNALAARGAFLGLNDGTSAVIAEGGLGSGRILASQLLALDLWGVDSVATLYLRNLATHLLTPAKPTAPLRAWAEPVTALRVRPESCRAIDLRAAANRSFSDEADGDGTGGWTDQGANDFSTMPLGAQVLQGVPFTILDPAANADRSCIVLGGGGRPHFPREALGIPVGGCADRLFFLHTAAWIAPRGATVLTYRITYADGTRHDIAVRSGIEIADWWNPGELRGALLGLSQTNAQLKDIALFIMPWDNPRPDQPIASIDCISSGSSVPIVVAITAESGNATPVRFLGAADPKAWKALVEWPGRDAQRDGSGLPSINTAASEMPGAVRISYPEAPAPGEAKDRYWGAPTAFTALPAPELSRLSSGTFRQLSFWIRGSQVGTLDLVLPCQGWKNSLQATVSVDPAVGWRKVRLDLVRDLQPSHSRNWKLSDLKGELFLYHGRRIARDAPRPAALEVEIADPRLE
ncbi:MAG: glycoside hydrolase family 2 [Planctomycetes bacterium]|nr:glycoside hydrolase family 2 [Planctomycetota bacterium]